MRKINFKTISVLIALLLCSTTPAAAAAHMQGGQRAGAKRSDAKGKAVPKGLSDLDDDISPKAKGKPPDQSSVGNKAKANPDEISDPLADGDTQQADSAPANTAAASSSTAPSAGTPAQALKGKVGDVLSDGKWRFQVLDVQRVNSYTMTTGAEPAAAYNDDVSEWSSTKRVFLPKLGFKLVLLRCRAFNMGSQKRTLWVSKADTNNALIDTGGGSHLPLAYDFEGGPIQSRPLLGDAKLDFAILFSVPEGVQPTELVLTLKTNDWQEKGNDVRVTLVAGQKPTSAHTAGDDAEQRANGAIPVPSVAGSMSVAEDTAADASLSAAALASSPMSRLANMETLSARLSPKKPGGVRIGIIMPLTELGTGKAESDNASEALRNTFAEYLNGPTLEIVPLASRVTAQALAEARQSDCDYVLFTTLALRRAGGSANPFGKAVGGIATSSAANVGDAIASSVARGSKTKASAADATASSSVGASAGSAVRVSARDAVVAGIKTATALASAIQAKDEFRLEYKLAPVAGAPAVLARTEKLKAATDGEDLITRLVARASEAIGLAVTKK